MLGFGILNGKEGVRGSLTCFTCDQEGQGYKDAPQMQCHCTQAYASEAKEPLSLQEYVLLVTINESTVLGLAFSGPGQTFNT